jgi:hypothetical protein
VSVVIPPERQGDLFEKLFSGGVVVHYDLSESSPGQQGLPPHWSSNMTALLVIRSIGWFAVFVPLA